MGDNDTSTLLRQEVEQLTNTTNSITDVLNITQQLAELNKDDHANELARAQKNALIDSVSINKFHRKYKEWQNSRIDSFITNEVTAYNKRYAEMSRLHSEILEREGRFNRLQQRIRLPQLEFSYQTLSQYADGKLLEHVPREANGEHPKRVPIEQIFSLYADSELPQPTLDMFRDLINLEYRLRLVSQIKYELLLKVKTHLTTKNSQWAKRDQDLNDFISKDFAHILSEIDKIKKSEHEDLKYFDYDYDMDIDDLEDGEMAGEDDENDGEEEERTEEDKENEEGNPREADTESDAKADPEHQKDTPQPNPDGLREETNSPAPALSQPELDTDNKQGEESDPEPEQRQEMEAADEAADEEPTENDPRENNGENPQQETAQNIDDTDIILD